MTREEKTKAYDEAIERARRIKNGEDNWRYSDLTEIIPALEEVLPELAESEDDEKTIKKTENREEVLEFAAVSFLIQKDKRLKRESRELSGQDMYDAFIAGAEWQREQMMKDAVEGEIGCWNQRGLSIRLDQSLEKLGYGEDTEVKIIIVKNAAHRE